MNDLAACFCGGVHIRSDVALSGVGLVACPDYHRYFNAMIGPVVCIDRELLTRMPKRIPRPEQVW